MKVQAKNHYCFLEVHKGKTLDLSDLDLLNSPQAYHRARYHRNPRRNLSKCCCQVITQINSSLQPRLPWVDLLNY